MIYIKKTIFFYSCFYFIIAIFTYVFQLRIHLLLTLFYDCSLWIFVETSLKISHHDQYLKFWIILQSIKLVQIFRNNILPNRQFFLFFNYIINYSSSKIFDTRSSGIIAFVFQGHKKMESIINSYNVYTQRAIHLDIIVKHTCQREATRLKK